MQLQLKSSSHGLNKFATQEPCAKYFADFHTSFWAKVLGTAAMEDASRRLLKVLFKERVHQEGNGRTVHIVSTLIVNILYRVKPFGTP